GSVMSFTATNSMAGSPSEARKMLRPMRPNPLIPTLIGMLPPRCGGDSSAQQDRTERKPEAKQTMLGRVWEKVKPSEPRAAISESDQSGVEVRAYLALFLIGWGRCRDRAHFRTRVPSGISACKRRRYGQAVG